MPELPEVETVVRGLNRLILKKKISKVKHDWPKSFPNAPKDVEDFMVSAEISKVSRRGKAIILKLNNEYTLVTHLRMTGQMVYRGEENWGAGHPNEDFLNDLPNKSTRVEIDFEDGTKLFFNDQRKFGYMKLLPDFEVELLPFFQKLGPEPLEDNFTEEVLKKQLSRKRKSMVKPAILD
ncbi:MAG: formamidopyrimidine-DNA glycosylase, partial [Candidatus Nanogingivalaceae bacterium]|nr:formamidopyrimidine-DNA glycosylase [Candidatus Nanogingivalaceae bacterium]